MTDGLFLTDGMQSSAWNIPALATDGDAFSNGLYSNIDIIDLTFDGSIGFGGSCEPFSLQFRDGAAQSSPISCTGMDTADPSQTYPVSFNGSISLTRTSTG
jgi:hypothetical protein